MMLTLFVQGKELPEEDDLVRLFGDLARISLEDMQSNAAAGMTCVRQLEGQKAVVSQCIEQHTQEGKQIEEELRKMGLNSGSLMVGRVRRGEGWGGGGDTWTDMAIFYPLQGSTSQSEDQ